MLKDTLAGLEVGGGEAPIHIPSPPWRNCAAWNTASICH
jgi:hypothetical protein